MCPEYYSESDTPRRLRVHQRGFAIVTGIFLLLFLAALGAFMVTLSTSQNVTSAEDLQGIRAYQAAHAGIELGVYKAVIGHACAGVINITSLTGDLALFAVKVEATGTPFTEGGVPGNICDIKSTATIAGVAVGSINFIERQLNATVAY